MPNNISLANVVEKNKLNSDVAQLVALEVRISEGPGIAPVEILYFVDNPEAVVHMGITYEPASFDTELRISAGGQPELTVQFVDITRTLQGRMQEYGGGIGSTVVLRVINGSLPNEPPAVMEHFEILLASSRDYNVSFTLGADNGVGSVFPGRRQRRDLCGWRYKDEDCGYSGGLATCDLTLRGSNGCEAHNNTERFGGYPGISGENIYYG